MFDLQQDGIEMSDREPKLGQQMSDAAEPQAEEKPIDNMSATLETILVVDDEPGVLDLVKVILSRQGYKILVADSGLKALEVCERHGRAIDLLLTDVMMPGMSGVALARRLQSLSQNLPVLYMTGGTLESLGDGELDPRSALLRKPFDPLSLVRTVRDFLNSTRSS